MNSVLERLMRLIRTEISDEECDKIFFAGFSVEEWKTLFSFAQKFDLAHFVADAAMKYRLTAEENLIEQFRKNLVTTVFRFQKLESELTAIKRVLDGANIPYIPLKGAVLRHLYPEPWMRTSCDVDILVHQEDLERAQQALEENGCTRTGQTSHDIGLSTQNGMHVELHHTLIESGMIGKTEQLLNDIWDYSDPINESCEFNMRDEAFYYYHLAHMAKHLEAGGGCGIRPFIDLWILNHRDPLNAEKRDELLKSGGLDRFATVATELSEYWMNGIEPSKLALQLEAVILSGGTYGSVEKSIIIRRGKQKTKFHYLLYRIWMPYDLLVSEYPNLRDKRILQPFYEFCRWLKIFNKGVIKRSASELKTSMAVSEDQRNEALQLLDDLGLL